ncbi:MAG TPA: S9 family peptidase [Xanthobacteraceae bacterium]|jgi:dipeptidyl aminopeptidase/acylaminoacyl peptidase|nr:S9 family peptidase [Xanthobacteraceae bacterium]
MATLDLDRRRLLAAAAGAGALMLSAGPTRAQAPGARPLIPRRLLFGDPERSIVRISPDGRRIAFLAPLDGVLNVWIAPLDAPGEARPLTRVTDRNVGPALLWLHNNRHIVYFREHAGDENWQAHRVDVETGAGIPLTPGPGVKSFVHQTSHHFPDELLIAHNERDKRFFDIFRVNVATGQSTLLQANNGFVGFFTDPQFRVRFAVRTTVDGGWDYLERGGDGDWHLFAKIDMADAMTTRPIEFSDDGKELYWLDSRGRDKAAVVAQDLVTGARRELAADARADMVELALDPVTYRPIAGESVFTRRAWSVIDRAYADDFTQLAKACDGDLTSLFLSDDRRQGIAYYERDVGPGHFFHYDRDGKSARFLFSAWPALDKVPLVPLEPVVVRARDGRDLVCYLSRPRDAAKGRPLPMVLCVHGGPWARDGWGFDATHQWLADRGYAVLSVNYRGSTGFGKDFVNAANLEWAGKMHDDLIEAVDWAVARGIADEKRVAIFGGSYGGYAALVGVTFTPEKFACAVDLVGISNLLTFVRAIPDYWKPWQTIWKVRMGDYTTEAGQRFLQERSPLNRVDRIVRPLLIAQGANDVRVKAAESEQIVKAMQARGIPVTYLYYSDEGHGFRRPENRRSFTAVAEMFLAKHLGGRFEPVGDDFDGSTIEFRAGRDLISGL